MRTSRRRTSRTSGTWTATGTTLPSGRTTCTCSPSVSSGDPGAPSSSPPDRRGASGGGGDRPPLHWSVIGSGKMATDEADPVNPALPVSLRLDLTGGESGVANDGYWGIPVRPDTTFTASFYARGGGGFA